MTNLEKETILYNRLISGDMIDLTWTVGGGCLARKHVKGVETYTKVTLENVYDVKYLRSSPSRYDNPELESVMSSNSIIYKLIGMPRTVARGGDMGLIRAIFNLIKPKGCDKAQYKWLKEWVGILEEHQKKIQEVTSKTVRRVKGYDGLDVMRLLNNLPSPPPDWRDHEKPDWVLKQIQENAKKLLEGEL
jgi:hypothetical protein